MTKIQVTHAEMSERLQAWIQESGYEEFDEHSLELLVGAFKAGHSACMDVIMPPAISLAMVLLRMLNIPRTAGLTTEEPKIVITGQALTMLEGLCRKILGDISLIDLVDSVQAVELTPDSAEDEAPP